jgi:hypothetical protein
MSRKGDSRKPMPKPRPKPAGPVGIDQRPGEEVVQVNDAYSGGGPPPDEPTKDEQHPTGG